MWCDCEAQDLFGVWLFIAFGAGAILTYLFLALAEIAKEREKRKKE